MPEPLPAPQIDRVDLAAPDSHEPVAWLLAAYLRQTEEEKRRQPGSNGVLTQGQGSTRRLPLPSRYQQEIADPGAAFADGDVFLARRGEQAVGLVAMVPVGLATVEIKRLWVEPEVRGTGLGSALIREALRVATGRGCDTARLTVWQWRTDALALYTRLGFEITDPWDRRPGLVCLQRNLHPVRAAS